MLVQWFHREAKGHGARASRAMLRHPLFNVAVLSSWGLVHDYGLLLAGTSYLTRFRRSQLSILLAGHGYFETARGPITLAPGSAILSDQRLQEPEGYAGSPCELLAIEWEEGAPFGPMVEGAARVGRIDGGSVSRLRALVGRLGTTPSADWLRTLTLELRTLGLCERSVEQGELTAPVALVRAYDALGEALGRLDDHPSLPEIAETLGLSERQAHRQLQALSREFAHPFDGWRDFVHESRIEWAMQLLSIPGVSVGRVAQLAGYRSSVALAHAFSLRGGPTPGTIVRTHAERWR